MTLDEYNRFCRALAHTHHVVQWEDSHVWKVGGAKGKVFALAALRDGPGLHISFKVSPLTFDLLKDRPGIRPAPYLASRGLIWLQRFGDETVDDAAMKDYLRESHRLASLNLTKRLQRELGLNG